jgi:ABC-2 type transport system ATP-binding protein
MSDNLVIRTHALTKYFGRKCAVDQVTFAVPRGSVFALLGRNGSGKTTLIRMLLGQLEPTRGSANILGDDCSRIGVATLGRIAYVAEGHPLFDWMRIADLESFQKPFYPSWNARVFKTVVDHFGLDPKSRAGKLSRGQRAGVSLALALATQPELLVMDDPATGLDPVARRTLLEAMILLTRDAGNTIFFSSHVLADVERVADHVAILDDSILRVSCPVETFRSRVKRVTLSFADKPPALPTIPGLLQATRDNHELQLIVAHAPEDAPRQLAQSLGALSADESPLSLEDPVIAYLGKRGEQASLLQKTTEAGVA